MTEEDESLNARVPGCLGKCTRAFDVSCKEIAAPSLGGRAGKVIHLIYAAQRGTDTALVVQADDRNLDRDPFRNPRRMWRRAEEYANLISRFGEMTNEGASDKSRCACD
jgi:hypothetical protein